MSELRTSKQTVNDKAFVALLLGMLSIITSIVMFVGITIGFIGLVVGIISLKEIAKTEQKGWGLAVAGLICSIAGIISPLLVLMLYYINH